MARRFDKYETGGALHWRLLADDPFYRVRGMVVASALGATDRCLDLGCGDGAYLSLMSPRCAGAVGVDSCKLAVKLARRELASRGVRNVQVVWSDVKDAPARVGHGAFEVAYSLDVIEHLDTPSELVGAAMAALRPGGRFFLGTPLFAGERYVSPYHVREFTLDGLCAAVRPFCVSRTYILPAELPSGVGIREYAILELRP